MEYNIQNDETEIDLGRLFITMVKKWRTILIVGIIGAFLAGSISAFTVNTKPKIVPTYESKTTMEILFIEEDSEQMKAALELTRSRTVMEQVIKDLKVDMTADELLESVSVENQKDSNTLKITVSNTKANRAKDLADAVREAAIEFINNSMYIDSYRVIEQANLPNEPVNEDVIEETTNESFNNILTKTIIGGILGVLGTIFVIFIQFALNDKIQTPDDVERYLGKRVLASIPMMKEQKNSKMNAAEDRGVK